MPHVTTSRSAAAAASIKDGRWLCSRHQRTCRPVCCRSRSSPMAVPIVHQIGKTLIAIERACRSRGWQTETGEAVCPDKHGERVRFHRQPGLERGLLEGSSLARAPSFPRRCHPVLPRVTLPSPTSFGAALTWSTTSERSLCCARGGAAAMDGRPGGRGPVANYHALHGLPMPVRERAEHFGGSQNSLCAPALCPNSTRRFSAVQGWARLDLKRCIGARAVAKERNLISKCT